MIKEENGYRYIGGTGKGKKYFLIYEHPESGCVIGAKFEYAQKKKGGELCCHGELRLRYEFYDTDGDKMPFDLSFVGQHLKGPPYSIGVRHISCEIAMFHAHAPAQEKGIPDEVKTKIATEIVGKFGKDTFLSNLPDFDTTKAREVLQHSIWTGLDLDTEIVDVPPEKLTDSFDFTKFLKNPKGNS